jgi:gamma-glutamylcyclotransferase (GGCT)/AIG2-like uncharacterized protein YtfP
MQPGDEKVLMFLNGTAMSGLEGHPLIAGSRFVGPRRTAPHYRFYAVRDEFPGLVPVSSNGVSIVGELYEMDRSTWLDQLLPNEPAELRPGEVELDDGMRSNVMILELDRVAPDDHLVDIGEFGGWRAYMQHVHTSEPR